MTETTMDAKTKKEAPRHGLLDRAYHGIRSCLEGLGVTLRYIIRLGRDHSPTTIRYTGAPETKETITVQPRFRGHPFNETGKCSACQVCARACPIDCIWIEIERDEKNKLRPSRFDVDLTRCMYCALCARVCPTHSLRMLQEFETPGAPGPDGKRYIYLTNAGEWARQRQTGEAVREDPRGDLIVAALGLGFYTDEEKAEVEKAREEFLRARAEVVAKARAAKEAQKAKEAAEKAALREAVGPVREGEAPAEPRAQESEAPAEPKAKPDESGSGGPSPSPGETKAAKGAATESPPPDEPSSEAKGGGE